MVFRFHERMLMKNSEKSTAAINRVVLILLKLPQAEKTSTSKCCPRILLLNTEEFL